MPCSTCVLVSALSLKMPSFILRSGLWNRPVSAPTGTSMSPQEHPALGTCLGGGEHPALGTYHLKGVLGEFWRGLRDCLSCFQY
eukprot:750277-Amphidinium_carterae.2